MNHAPRRPGRKPSAATVEAVRLVASGMNVHAAAKVTSVQHGALYKLLARRGEGTWVERALKATLDFNGDGYASGIRCVGPSHDAGRPLIDRSF